MASTDALSLTPLAASDVPGCMALSAEAGWNQLPDDWTLFFDRGTVFGLPGAQMYPFFDALQQKSDRIRTFGA